MARIAPSLGRGAASAGSTERLSVRGREWLILGALCTLALVVRLCGLDSRSLWWDEAFTWNMARGDFGAYWAIQVAERHPPLYFASMWAWVKLAGTTEWAMRFWSVVPGVATVPLVWRLIGTLGGGRPAAALAAGVVAIWPALVLYSQEARMYSLFVMLTALAALLAGRFVTRGGWSLLVGLGLVEACLLLTHYFAVIAVVLLNLAIVASFWNSDRRVDLSRWFVAQAAAVVPLGLWTGFLLLQGRVSAGPEAAPSWETFSGETLTFLVTGQRDMQGEWAWVGWLAAAAAAAGIAAGVRRGNEWSLRWGALLVGGLVAGYGLALVLNSYHPRYVLPLVLPLVLVVVWLARNMSSTAVIAAGLAVLTAIGWVAAGAFPGDDPRSVARTVREDARPGDAVLLQDNDFTLAYYGVAPARITMVNDADPVRAEPTLRSALAGTSRVWVADWQTSTQDRAGLWPFLLSLAGYQAANQSFVGYRLLRWDLVRPVPERALTAVANGQLGDARLAGWFSPSTALEAVALELELEGGPTGLVISLYDGDAHLVNRVQLAGGPGRQFVTVPLPLGNPPESLFIGVAGNEREVILGEVRVERLVAHALSEVAGPWATIRDQAGAPFLDYRLFPRRVGSERIAQVDLRWHRVPEGGSLPPVVLVTAAGEVARGTPDVIERTLPTELWPPDGPVIDRRGMLLPADVREGTVWLLLPAGAVELGIYREEP